MIFPNIFIPKCIFNAIEVESYFLINDYGLDFLRKTVNERLSLRIPIPEKVSLIQLILS